MYRETEKKIVTMVIQMETEMRYPLVKSKRRKRDINNAIATVRVGEGGEAVGVSYDQDKRQVTYRYELLTLTHTHSFFLTHINTHTHTHYFLTHTTQIQTLTKGIEAAAEA